MQSCRRLIRTASRLAAAAALWACPVTLWAQDPPPAPPDKSSWAMGYILTVLAIALGLVVICRPGKRSELKKKTDDDE